MAQQIIDTSSIPTVEVPVKPLGTDSRTWLNIGLGLIMSTLASPTVQQIVQSNPWLALLGGVVTAGANVWLLQQSKKGVVSKNVTPESL